MQSRLMYFGEISYKRSGTASTLGSYNYEPNLCWAKPYARIITDEDRSLEECSTRDLLASLVRMICAAPNQVGERTVKWVCAVLSVEPEFATHDWELKIVVGKRTRWDLDWLCPDPKTRQGLEDLKRARAELINVYRRPDATQEQLNKAALQFASNFKSYQYKERNFLGGFV